MLASRVRELIGVDGGILPTSRMHRCKDCTHVKQYHTDLIAQGLALEAANVDEVVQMNASVRLLLHQMYIYHPNI